MQSHGHMDPQLLSSLAQMQSRRRRFNLKGRASLEPWGGGVWHFMRPQVWFNAVRMENESPRSIGHGWVERGR